MFGTTQRRSVNTTERSARYLKGGPSADSCRALTVDPLLLLPRVAAFLASLLHFVSAYRSVAAVR